MIFTSFIFVGTFIFFLSTTKFQISEIQLSYWGIDDNFGWAWNSCLMMLSLSMFFNVAHFIHTHPRLQFKKEIILTFLVVCMFLFLTGLAPMHNPAHKTVAWFYFLTYPLAIFTFVALNYKNLPHKEWLGHLLISTSLVILPVVSMRFTGLAIPETIHSVLILGWNLYICKNKTY